MKPKFVFFGGEPLGVPALAALKEADLLPELIVCSPDRPAGRGMELVSPPVKQWAQTNNIPVYQPESYQDEAVKERLNSDTWDLFVVVAYNFILPKWVLALPTHGCINVHPSLLPALRGPSPIRTAILENKPSDVGVTVMLLDQKMDTGPILKQIAIPMTDWPVRGPVLDTQLANTGGQLLAETIPHWLNGAITPQEQDNTKATYTSLFKKGDNEIKLNPRALPTGPEAIKLLCKICAWEGIGDTFFVYENTRIKIKTADLAADGSLQLQRIVPAGKREMDFSTYLQTLTAA